jgi:hypothetical protein
MLLVARLGRVQGLGGGPVAVPTLSRINAAMST